MQSGELPKTHKKSIPDQAMLSQLQITHHRTLGRPIWRIEEFDSKQSEASIKNWFEVTRHKVSDHKQTKPVESRSAIEVRRVGSL